MLLKAVTDGATIHGAWQQQGRQQRSGSTFPLSLTSAYRWINRWRRGTARIRPRLCLLLPPPPQVCAMGTDCLTLLHLMSAFPATARCPLAAFQAHFQTIIA